MEMNQDEFEKIVDKYIQNKATEQEKLYIESLLDSFQRPLKEWDSLKLPPKNHVKQEIYTEIIKKRDSKAKIKKLHPTIKIAASLAVFITLSIIGWVLFDNHRNNPSMLISEITTQGEKRDITLPDGTTVTLNSETKLDYYENFKRNRQVILSGEAFFQVIQNKRRPFVVHTNTLITKVLGTSFNISAYNQENTKVTVTEGKVQVNAPTHTGKDKIILKPDYQVVYMIKSNTIKTKKVQSDSYTHWKDGILEFNKLSFDESIDKMEKWYGTNIIVDNENLSNETIKATYNNVDITVILDDLEYLFGIKYHFTSQDTIIITPSDNE